MNRADKPIMRVWVLVLLLPVPVLHAPLPVWNSTTGWQQPRSTAKTTQSFTTNKSTATTTQSFTANRSTATATQNFTTNRSTATTTQSFTSNRSTATATQNLTRLQPHMVTNPLEATTEDFQQDDVTGTSEATNAAEYQTQSFEREITDFNRDNTTSGNSYIITTVTSRPTAVQGSDRYTTPRDLRSGETQSSAILSSTSPSENEAEQTAMVTLTADPLHSSTEVHIDTTAGDGDAGHLKDATVSEGDSNTPLFTPLTDMDSNKTITHPDRGYSTTPPHSRPSPNAASNDDKDTGLHTYINTNSETTALYKITTEDLQNTISKPTEQAMHTDNTLDSNGQNNTVHHTQEPDCDGQVKPLSPSRSSKLLCFLTLWALGVTAAVFLGLTVFLGVRLSIQRKKVRGRREGWVEMEGVRGMRRQGDSLWAQPAGTVEERVEFWYANRSCSDMHPREERPRKERGRRGENGIRGGERGRARETQSLWAQPKVTLEEISEFWYANGKPRQDQERQQL